MLALTLALAALIGLTLGLVGSGGSIVTLPILVYAAGIEAHQAVGMSLFIVGATSAIGTAIKIMQGQFHMRASLLFSATGVVGAFIGGKFTHFVSAPVLLVLFGSIMLVVGLRMLVQRDVSNQEGVCRPVRCLLAGLVVGLLTGFLGVGGGFLIVPALVLLAGIRMKPAIGTSLAVITLNSCSGLISHLQDINLNWHVSLQFVIAASIGMFAGIGLAGRFSPDLLRRGFAYSVLLLGAWLVVRNLMLV